MLTLKRVHGLVGTVQNKRILWRSMFWTLLVTCVVRARSYETINLIGTHCVRIYAPIAYIHEVMNVFRFVSRINDTSHIDPIEMLSVVSEAMKGQQMNLQDKFGQTPLHGAALRGAAICCMYIVEVRYSRSSTFMCRKKI